MKKVSSERENNEYQDAVIIYRKGYPGLSFETEFTTVESVLCCNNIED